LVLLARGWADNTTQSSQRQPVCNKNKLSRNRKASIKVQLTWRHSMHMMLTARARNARLRDGQPADNWLRVNLGDGQQLSLLVDLFL
jgi:hypothetical protein